MNPISQETERSLAWREALQKYDEQETVNGRMVGWGDAKENIYFGSFTPKHDYVIDGGQPFRIEPGKMPFMVHSTRGPSGCVHEAFIWHVGGWVNVFVSTILFAMDIWKRRDLTEHLERWLREGINPELEQRSPATPRKEGSPV